MQASARATVTLVSWVTVDLRRRYWASARRVVVWSWVMCSRATPVSLTALIGFNLAIISFNLAIISCAQAALTRVTMGEARVAGLVAEVRAGVAIASVCVMAAVV